MKKLNVELMQYEVNTNNIEVSFTYLQGYISTNLETLKKVFGEPIKYDAGSKTDIEYNILFADGEVATIYNYKNGKNYLGDDGQAVEEMTSFNVGGKDAIVLDRIQSILDVPEPVKLEPEKPKYFCLVRMWFDKVNGNTYHKVTMFYDGEIVDSGMTYGYERQYEVTAYKLASIWFMVNNKLSRREFNNLAHYEVVEVQKQRDLTE